MTKPLLLLLVCGTAVPGCVPGPVLVAPAVEAAVIDLRTLRPLAGARISVVGADETPDKPLAAGISDAQGRFACPARYAFGLVPLLGDAKVPRVTVRVTRAGYQDFIKDEQYSTHLGADQPLKVYADMEPEHDTARKNRFTYFAQ